MNVGILVAMDKEYHLIRSLLKNVKPYDFGIRKKACCCGKVGENTVFLAKCGIGKVNAAVTTTEFLNFCSLDALISTGVAGSLEKLTTGDVLASTSCQYWDVWCGEPNTKGQVQGLPVAYPSSADLFKKAYLVDGVKPGIIVSGDRFITSEDEKSNIRYNFPDADAVDMESAAIAQTCYLYNTNFISIRAISDGCDGKEYDNYWETLAKENFNVISKILKKL